MTRLSHRPNAPSTLPRAARWATFVLVAVALAACGDKGGSKTATQVAAKVGSEEISIHQINFVLSRTNTANVTPDNAQRLRQEVLEKLIDQQLAVDQAVENKLDRSPEVVSQLEAARREVLARAYVQRVAGGLPKPTTEEAQKYFNDNPALFSERRIYNLQEILVPAAGADVAEQVKAQVAAGKSMDEVAAWLKGRNLRFGGNSATRAAEQIPLELLKTVAALKDGQTTVISNAQGFTVLRVASSQSAPVTESAALPRIQQFLANQRGAEAVSKAIKDLRAKTTVTYMGDFQPGSAGAAAGTPATGAISTTEAAAPAAPAPAPTPAAAAAPPPVAPADVNPAVDDKTRAVIEKGIKGLK
ncbi:MAG: EpsD family peptidyl-prolyl cis-trans isomerase [Burkholderiaceae bacterium]